MSEIAERRLQHYCSSCAVGLHHQCVTTISPVATCLCAAEAHRPQEHPAVTGTRYREERGAPRSGEMRDVDYEREPFELRGPGGVSETHATKSKPRDDLEQAREDNAKVAERNAAKAALPWRF